jgi:hypothetical protein
MSSTNTLRKCNRCHVSKSDDCLSTNSKGELYKLCDNCRSKHNSYYKEYNETNKDKVKDYQQRSYNKFNEKPINEQYIMCDVCRCQVHLRDETMNRHIKRWNHVKNTMDGNPVEKEKYQLILDNRDNLLSDYRKLIPKAEEYFKINQ